MTNWELLRPYLPSSWVDGLAALPPQEGAYIQEVRLRANAPLTVSLPTGDRYLSAGGLSCLPQTDGFFCTRRCLEECFLAFCGHSVYAHQWELAQGYVAVEGGIRVGVAGTAVMRDAQVFSVREVAALCVRLPRRVVGCSVPLLPLVMEGERPISSLLIGPPSCGKTTLLRDLAAQLAVRHRRVAVVDERGELSAEGALSGCDVLSGYPKAVGLRQAVRCLAPECVLLDELGESAEVQAVADSAHAGVAVIASLHGYDPWQMARQPLVQEILRRGVFERWLFLQGRERPGVIRVCYRPEVISDGVDWRPVVDSGRCGDGLVCRSPSATAGDFFGNLRKADADLMAGYELYGTADGRSVATIGAK